MTKRIFIPERFEKDTIIPLIEVLDEFRDEHEVCVDFSNLRYSFPTSMLVVGSKIRDWVHYRVQQGYVQSREGIDPSRSCHSYLMHLGFFQFIHMDEGKSIGEAAGNRSYLPITRVSRPDFNPFDQSISDWYESIQMESRRLATVLSGNNGLALTLYTYCIREILRNVFEHSRAKECFICGQRWWNGKVEIVIIDEGVGVSSSLREAYDITSDSMALELAIKPGTSRTNSSSQAQNVFDNSGFGLYILSEVGARYGWFTIGSGAGRLVGWESERNYDNFSFSGTFFGMQINKPVGDFGLALSEIIATGEKLSNATGISKKASGASKLPEF